MYQFPIATKTNYHKPVHRKQQKYMISHFWNVEVENMSQCKNQGIDKIISGGDCREEVIPFTFLASEYDIPWLISLSSEIAN